MAASRPRAFASLTAVLLLAVLAQGCGYTLGGAQGLPGDVRTLHIGKVDNTTLDVTLPPLLHSLFRQEIEKRDLAGWAGAREADGIVKLSVVSLSTNSRVTTTEGRTLKFQTTVVLRGTLTHRVDQKQVWDSGDVAGEETFFDPAEESAAVSRAMEFAVRYLVDSMTATF